METTIPERAVEKYLKDRVKGMGGLSYKFSSPGEIGVPDRIVMLKGKIIYVETKTLTGRISPMQKYQHQRIRDQGFDVYVLRSFAEIDDLLKRWPG